VGSQIFSGADKKIVRRVGNYGSEVSLSCRSHAQLQRVCGGGCVCTVVHTYSCFACC